MNFKLDYWAGRPILTASGTIFGTNGLPKLSRKDKLIEKARNNPRNLRFSEFCTIFKKYGFARRPVSSGHVVYERKNEPKAAFPIQDNNGKAIPYQVKQLVGFLEAAGLINRQEDGNG